MSRYSKKHYEDIAEIIDNISDGTNHINRETLIRCLAVMFRQDNPNFDWDRFVEACKWLLTTREPMGERFFP